MKQIESYQAKKYTDPVYQLVQEGIYSIQEDDEIVYLTSLSFIQEPEFEEGEKGLVSQYPLEDILDKFYCYINDFYPDISNQDSEKAYLEFASPDLEDIKQLRSIIGKHVYNKVEGDTVALIIE
ncbi:hypothetical protein ACVRXF_01480 [Streptococcus orisasini]